MSVKDGRFAGAGLALALGCSWALAGCAPAPVEEPIAEAAAADTAVLETTRDQVEGDLYHYSWLVRVGNTPNAHIRIHRIVREEAPGGRSRPCPRRC
jgi:hypothetical protein